MRWFLAALAPVTVALDCTWQAEKQQRKLRPADASCTRLRAKEVALLPREDLAQTVLQLPHLTELHLSSLQLGDQRFEEICQVFMRGRHVALERLYLAHNNLGAPGAIALAKSLPALPNLKVLNLPENAIRAQGAEALARALSERTPLLEQLVLAGNGIGVRGAQALALAMPKLQRLQDLHLSRNALGTQGALAIARALHQGHGAVLEWLSLSENALGDVGLQALAASLKRTPVLEWLDLEGNSLTDLGIVALGRSLCSQQMSLRELMLQKNLVGAEGRKWLEAAKVQLPGFQFWTDHPSGSVPATTWAIPQPARQESAAALPQDPKPSSCSGAPPVQVESLTAVM